jgi:hypothetical protein
MTNVHVGAPSLTLLHMMTGCWISQALYVAAQLGIADLLQEGPQSCTSLAEATQTHAGALYRVLRALASVGVFNEDEAGCFRLTPLAEPLCTDTPGSRRAFALMLGAPEHWRAWEGMLHSVRTGQPAFDHVFGVGCNRSHNSTCQLSSFRTLTRFKTLAICCLNRRPCR